MIRTLWSFRQSVQPHLGLLAFGVLLTVADTILSLANPWALKSEFAPVEPEPVLPASRSPHGS
jgi:hypothetical protein